MHLSQELLKVNSPLSHSYRLCPATYNPFADASIQESHLSLALIGILTSNNYQMEGHLPPGIAIVKSDDLREWQMDIQVLDKNPLYENETYRLKFTFSDKYPIGTQLLNIPDVDDQ